MAFLRPYTSRSTKLAISSCTFSIFIKPDMRSYSNFRHHKSAIACYFRIVFGFDLGIDIFTKQRIKSWRIEQPPQQWHNRDEVGWDVSLIIQCWSTRIDNSQLDTLELGYKALTLFAVSVYPRVSDLARIARDKLNFLATAMRFHYFGTKELRSVPVFTRQSGISRVDCLRICLVLAM